MAGVSDGRTVVNAGVGVSDVLGVVAVVIVVSGLRGVAVWWCCDMQGVFVVVVGVSGLRGVVVVW